MCCGYVLTPSRHETGLGLHNLPRAARFLAICPNAMIDSNLIHKALAHPFRREILLWLKTPDEAFAEERVDLGHGVPSNAIHARSGLSQSTVSAHVATLIEAELLVPTRVGQWIFLSRNEEVIRAFAEQISLHL
jgi:ArsR family transcriptional regulator